MPDRTAHLPLLNHFTIAIFPFAHDLTPDRPVRRLQPLARWWAPWWSRLTRSTTAAALDASAFFLPYVQSQLYPETDGLQGETTGPHYDLWVSRLWRWGDRGLVPFCQRLPPDCVLRLTCRQEALARLSRFSIPAPESPNGTHTSVPVRVDWVDTMLFPTGVGFLLLKVQIDEERPLLTQLIALNQTLHLTHSHALSRPLPRLRFADGAEAHMGEVLNSLVRGLAAGTDAPTPDAGWPEFCTAEQRRGDGYLDSAEGRAHGDRCTLLSYACVDASPADWAALPAGAFASAEDRILFEYAAGLGVGRTIDDPVWEPAPEQAKRLAAENRMHAWRCWRLMALKEAVAFLATDRIGYNQGTLPRNVEQMYLPLYLYALHQRHVLLRFADRLLRSVGQAGGPVREARALLDQFIGFRTRYWFNEVTQRPQGGELYRLLQRALEVPALYELVTGSVKEAREYYQERRDRQVRAALTVLGLVFGPLTTLFSGACLLLGQRPETLVQGLLPTGAGWGVLLGAASFVGVGATAWYLGRASSQSRRPRGRRSARRRKQSAPPAIVSEQPSQRLAG